MTKEPEKFTPKMEFVHPDRSEITPSDRRLASILATFDNPFLVSDSDTPAEEMKVIDDSDLDCEKPYDPHDYCIAEHPTSFLGTVFHTVILLAGPGVLSIPVLFVNAGYLIGAILVPYIFCLYVHNANMLIWSQYQLCKTMRTPSLSYPEVAYYAFKEGPKFSQWLSKWSRKLTYVDFVIVWYSYYCYNYVIVCENLRILARYAFHADISFITFLEIITVPMLFLACIPKLKYLVPVSFIGTVCHGLSLVLIVYFIFSDQSPWMIPPMVGDLNSIPLLIGSVLVNINTSGMLVPLKNEMKEPHKFATSWFSVLIVSYVPTSLVYSTFSLICALKYGNKIQASVIQNLPQDNLVAHIGVGLSSIAIVCQQPLILIVSYDTIWNQILKKKLRSEYPVAWGYVLKIVLVILAFITCMAAPNVFLFLSVSGTIGTSIDSFILPAAIHTVLIWKMCENKRRFWLIFVKNMVNILFAVILAVIGCVYCIREISNLLY